MVWAEIKLLLCMVFRFNLHWSCFQSSDHKGMSVTRRIEATTMYTSDQGNKVIYLLFVKQRCHKVESVYRNFNIYRIFWLVLNWYRSLSKYFYVFQYTHVNCRNQSFSTIQKIFFTFPLEWYERSSKIWNFPSIEIQSKPFFACYVTKSISKLALCIGLTDLKSDVVAGGT